MRLPVPGPRDVLSMIERSADAVEQLLGAIPRMVAVVDHVEQLVNRVDRLIDRIEGTRESAADVVERTRRVSDRAEELLAHTVPLVDRLRELLDRMEPSLTTLQPTLDRLAETTDPREVDALVQVIDMLPELAHKLETDVVPVMNSLNSVAPDVHDLLDVTRELNEMIGSLPVLKGIKKRVNEEQAAEGRG